MIMVVWSSLVSISGVMSAGRSVNSQVIGHDDQKKKKNSGSSSSNSRQQFASVLTPSFDYDYHCYCCYFRSGTSGWRRDVDSPSAASIHWQEVGGGGGGLLERSGREGILVGRQFRHRSLM